MPRQHGSQLTLNMRTYMSTAGLRYSHTAELLGAGAGSPSCQGEGRDRALYKGQSKMRAALMPIIGLKGWQPMEQGEQAVLPPRQLRCHSSSAALC